MSTTTPPYGAGSAKTDPDRADLEHSQNVAVNTRSGINPELWARIWFVLAMAALAYFVQLSEIGRFTFAGSQSAYLVVAPILVGLVAAGYSHPPRGVIDAESDWISALLLCVGGFAAIWLVEDRLPTMAALWNVDYLGLMIWVVASGMVVFSTRHVLRMWNVWLLGLLFAPVMPFMLLTAHLGGSDVAIAMTSAALGTMAVFLAGRFVEMLPRLLATAANIALSVAAVLLLADASLYLRVLIAAGVVPLVVVLALYRSGYRPRTASATSVGSTLPKTKPWSYAAVFVAAIALLVVHLPGERPAPVEEIRSDWIAASALDPVEEFPFITSFLGPDSSLTRYQAPGGTGEYQTVVDVMTSPNLARLQDFSDAVWYPSTTPVNYAPYEGVSDAPAGTRTAHSNADSATTGDAAHWNSVSWVWRSGSAYQLVTVITSQSRDVPAPAPRPLSVENSFVKPMLWIARQQPSEVSVVDPIVLAGTESVVQRLLAVGEPLVSGDLAP